MSVNMWNGSQVSHKDDNGIIKNVQQPQINDHHFMGHVGDISLP